METNKKYYLDDDILYSMAKGLSNQAYSTVIETSESKITFSMRPLRVNINETVKFFRNFPNFGLYLEKKDSFFDSFELPYMVFGKIIDYLRVLSQSKNINEIQAILDYLDILSLSTDQNIRDLLLAGALEAFDRHKEILPELVNMMPKI